MLYQALSGRLPMPDTPVRIEQNGQLSHHRYLSANAVQADYPHGYGIPG